MHQTTLEVAKRWKPQLSGRVLEIGSLNVNGSLREVLDISVGIDIVEGPGVDLVLPGEEVHRYFGKHAFDAVVSSDALEHVRKWRSVLKSAWAALKPNGHLLLTMASERKGRHNYPNDYWRFPFAQFLRIAGDNQILESFDDGPSMGMVVQKTCPLWLEGTPVRI